MTLSPLSESVQKHDIPLKDGYGRPWKLRDEKSNFISKHRFFQNTKLLKGVVLKNEGHLFESSNLATAQLQNLSLSKRREIIKKGERVDEGEKQRDFPTRKIILTYQNVFRGSCTSRGK